MKSILSVLSALSLLTLTGVAAARSSHAPSPRDAGGDPSPARDITARGELRAAHESPPTRGGATPSKDHARGEQPLRLCHTSPRACVDAPRHGAR